MIIVSGNKILIGKEELEDFSSRTFSPHYKERWQDKDGLAHREDGPAVVHNNGATSWYKHGLFHRVDGPAVKTTTWEGWFIDGKYHREDGPAYVDKISGNNMYLLNDIEVTEDAVRALGKMK